MKNGVIVKVSALAMGALVVPFVAAADCYDPPAAFVQWGKCQFARKNFEGANLKGAILTDAVLHHAKLKGINLEDADLRNVNFRF
ncbi:MAG TPA: pentapeptide repeat-containing protein, partial [Rhodospirillales bacterium]